MFSIHLNSTQISSLRNCMHSNVGERHPRVSACALFCLTNLTSLEFGSEKSLGSFTVTGTIVEASGAPVDAMRQAKRSDQRNA
jgi:hypothetical protein